MLDTLNSFITVLLALSVATERLVEIVKGLPIPGLNQWLNQKQADPAKEAWRAAFIQLMAVAAGILTSYLAAPFVAESLHKVDALKDVKLDSPAVLAGLGLLASGGSGMWNSALSYLKSAKDIKDSVANTVTSQAPTTLSIAQPMLGGGGRS